MSGEVALLERAVDYALSAVEALTPALLTRRTPCAGWDLRMLLRHLRASVDALHEGVTCQRVSLFASGDDEALVDPIGAVRGGVIRLLDDWPRHSGSCGVAIADQWLPLPMLAAAAAFELTVHGWDVSLAPIPPVLASELLALAPLLVPEGSRRQLFAPPIHLSGPARPEEALLAFAGRPFVSARQVEEVAAL